MRNVLYLIYVLIFLYSCTDDKENVTVIPQQSNLVLSSYPLENGNSWKYFTESFIVDSAGTIISSQYFDNKWTCITDTVINGILSTKILQLDSNYNGNVFQDFSYYSSTVDGFYGVATQGTGSLFFLKKQFAISETKIMSNFGSVSIHMDTVFVLDTALRLLKFPSSINDTWRSHEYPSYNPSVIKRTWLKDTSITTVVGTFECLKLQMFYDFNNDNLPDSNTTLVNQYFSNQGLIQENVSAILFFAGSTSPVFWSRESKLVWKNF